MSVVKVTSKGQVTIPATILDAAGIEKPYPTQTLRLRSDLGMNDDRSE